MFDNDAPEAVKTSNLTHIGGGDECHCWDHTGGGCWPRTEYTESIVEGQLAQRIRDRVGATPDATVILREVAHVGGYSEYTQETSYQFTVRCWGEEYDFVPVNGWNPLMSLLAWLDEEDHDVER